ncbi:MAG: XRE family transcriptional regulator [bacterium]
MVKTDVAGQVAVRMKQARQEMGFTLRDAARLLGFGSTYQILSSIEKGVRQVKTAELVQFAKVYNRDLSYFLGAAQPAAQPVVRWRNCAGTPEAKQAEQKFRQFLSDYAELEELSGRGVSRFAPGGTHRVSGWREVEELGRTTRQSLELGGRPALELRTVLEEKYGVKLLIAAMPGAGSAASAMDGFGAGVLVNATDAPWRISFDIAHELFHLLTWEQEFGEEPTAKGSGKLPSEQYADAFAAALLMPEESIGPEFRSRLKDGELAFLDCIEMARAFGVSTEALLWRLVSLRMLSRESVKQAMATGELKDVDKSVRKDDWADHPGAKPSRRFVTIAFECLKKGLVSRGRFAELMGIRRGEIAGFLAEYGYDEMGDYVGSIGAS